MGPYLYNHREIVRRGGVDYGNSAFRVLGCGECGRQYLFDEEVLVLYPDPVDLRINALLVEGEFETCIGCQSDLDVVELAADSDEVADGPWSWAR